MVDELGPGPHNPCYGMFTDEIILNIGGPCILGLPQEEPMKQPELPAEYEYAGFRYTITAEHDHGYWTAKPLPGQHPAANKEKHRRAAIERFIEEIKSAANN